jgi:hypothetical protein
VNYVDAEIILKLGRSEYCLILYQIGYTENMTVLFTQYRRTVLYSMLLVYAGNQHIYIVP